MSPICSILRGSFGDYLRDDLPLPQRRIFRDHLAACEECRRLAQAHDPTFLFARPLREEVSNGETEQILAAVRTGVALIRSERRIVRARWRRRFASVAAAAALAMLTLFVDGGSARRAEPQLAARPTPSMAEEAQLQPSALPAEADARASDATIYDWNPGSGPGEPRVVWIVDRGLDI